MLPGVQVDEATQQLKTNNMKLKGLLNQVGLRPRPLSSVKTFIFASEMTRILPGASLCMCSPH